MYPKEPKELSKELVDLDFKQTENEKNPLLDSVVISMHESKKSEDFFKLPKQSQPLPPPARYFWHLEYYMEYFDISTETVIRRIKKAIWPFGAELFVETERKSDLYVPLWTFITLVIMMSTFGSIVHGMKEASENNIPKLKIRLEPDRIFATFSILLFYLIINPCFLYGLLKYKGSKVRLCELLCLYGYSYLPFIPMSLLYGIQITLFQVIVLFGAAFISTFFLYRNLNDLCQSYLQSWMEFVRPYMIIVQILFIVLIYFKIYN